MAGGKKFNKQTAFNKQLVKQTAFNKNKVVPAPAAAKSYSCEKCSASFPSFLIATKHEASCKNKVNQKGKAAGRGKVFKPMTTTGSAAVAAHRAAAAAPASSAGGKGGNYSCEKCGRGFPTYAAAGLHEKTCGKKVVQGMKVLQGKSLGKGKVFKPMSMTGSSAVAAHRAVNAMKPAVTNASNATKYGCESCGANFPAFALAQKHEAFCKSKVNKPGKAGGKAGGKGAAAGRGPPPVGAPAKAGPPGTFSCEKCNRNFPTYAAAVLHEKTCIKKVVQGVVKKVVANVAKPAAPAAPAAAASFSCEKCGRGFRAFQDAVQHEAACKAKRLAPAK